MFKRSAKLFAAVAVLVASAAGVLIAQDKPVELEIGKPAPAFSLPNTKGETISLADFKGKTVVLEWLNHGCPFVKKHYETNNMQSYQDLFTQKGIVWLSLVSSAPGKQGHYATAEEAEADRTAKGSKATHVLLDPVGTVGRAYGARTTPHMYIVGADGNLAYAGAIDDKPGTKNEDVVGAKNYVADALNEILAGKPVTTATTKAYGCSVKYANAPAMGADKK